MKNAVKGGTIAFTDPILQRKIKATWDRKTESFTYNENNMNISYKFEGGIIIRKNFKKKKRSFLRAEKSFVTFGEDKISLKKIVRANPTVIRQMRSRNRQLKDKKYIENLLSQWKYRGEPAKAINTYISMKEDQGGLLGLTEAIRVIGNNFPKYTKVYKERLRTYKNLYGSESIFDKATELKAARRLRKSIIAKCSGCVLDGSSIAPGRINLDAMSPALRKKYLKALSTEVEIEKKHSTKIWRRWNKTEKQDTPLLPYLKTLAQSFIPDLKDAELNELTLHPELGELKDYATYSSSKRQINASRGSGIGSFPGGFEQNDALDMGILMHEIYHHYQSKVLGIETYDERVKHEKIYDREDDPDYKFRPEHKGIGAESSNREMSLEHTLEYYGKKQIEHKWKSYLEQTNLSSLLGS